MIDIQIRCYQCNQELKIEDTETYGDKKYGKTLQITIQPCESCLKEAEEQKEIDINSMMKAYRSDF